MKQRVRLTGRGCRAVVLGLLLAGGLPCRVAGAAVAALAVPDLETAIAGIGARESDARRNFARGLDAFEANEWALAERLWLPAARAGNLQARYHLALLYDRLAPGSMAALIWYRRAARDGHSDAQHNLALAYLQGEGVPRDLSEAIYWWTRAARQGNVDSQYNLGLVYALGREGLVPDRARARYWWLQAARHGDPAAQYNLATLYASEPARPDYCLARRWFLASSRNGFPRAAEALARLPGPASACR